MRGASCSRSRSSSTARSRGTRYSVCSSSPELGVKSSLKCGSRSCHGPATPSCSVQCTASCPGSGWRLPSASRPSSRPPPAHSPSESVAPLHPDLAAQARCPAGEEADAVGTGERLVERVEQRRVADVVEHVLAHVEGRLDREVHGGRDPQRAQGHDGTVEGGGRRLGRQDREVPVRRDELEAAHGRAEGRVAVTGAVRPGRHGAGHGDVPQRRHVVDGPAGGVERRGRLPVAHTAGHPRDPPLGVHLDGAGQAGDGDVDARRCRRCR